MKMQIKLPPFLQKWNYPRMLMISAIVFVVGLFFGYVTPKVVKSIVTSRMQITPNSDIRELYVKVPFYIGFNIYVFNLTNPKEFAQGAKAKLQEVGPYFFEEWKEKFNLTDDEEEDTLTYHYKNTFKFRPDLSNGLTGDEIITTPHPLITTMLLSMNVNKRPMLGMVASAIDILFNYPSDMFWTGRAMDYLFDGIPIDCSNLESFQAKAVCGTFEAGDVKSVKPINSTHYEFSFFQPANGSDLGELTVFRGLKNYQDLGRVIALNGDTELNNWNGDECNQFIGTDGTIFPSYMNPKDGIWAFERSICRSIETQYVKQGEYMGMEVSEFKVDFGSKNNAKDCYCRGPGKCPKNGTFDMFQCVSAPMIGSMPHFYGADPSILNDFESGLKPIKEKHAIYSFFEATTGTPLAGTRRMQYNLEMAPLSKVPYMANIRHMYYPMFWVDEGLSLDDSVVDKIKYSVILAVKTQRFLKWICLTSGGVGMLVSAALLFITLKLSPKEAFSPTSGTKDVEK